MLFFFQSFLSIHVHVHQTWGCGWSSECFIWSVTYSVHSLTVIMYIHVPCIYNVHVHVHSCVLAFNFQQFLTAIEKMDLSNNAITDTSTGIEVMT